RERVRVLPYHVAITCRLQQIYPGNPAEECIFTVLAEAPDGHQQTWGGYNWFQSNAVATQKKEQNQKLITVYDSSMLELVPRLLEPLALKSSSYGNGLAARVTKKFPELFCAWLKTVPPEITLQLNGEL